MPYYYLTHRAILNATTWLIKYYRLAEARLQARSRQSAKRRGLSLRVLVQSTGTLLPLAIFLEVFFLFLNALYFLC